MVYTLLFFSSKSSLFHNSNVFGSRIIHILYTRCAKIKKNNSGAKRLSEAYMYPWKTDLKYSAAKAKNANNINFMVPYCPSLSILTSANFTARTFISSLSRVYELQGRIKTHRTDQISDLNRAKCM